MCLDALRTVEVCAGFWTDGCPVHTKIRVVQNETATPTTSRCVPRSAGSLVSHPPYSSIKAAALPKMHTADASCLRTATGWVRMFAACVASQTANEGRQAMERHPVGMLLLQAIPHCRFGQILLGGFGGLKHGAYVCYMFLNSSGFATKIGSDVS